MGLLDRFRRPAPRVAATQPLDPNYRRIVRKVSKQPWQERASKFAREMGVIRFAGGLTSSSGARCTLRVEQCVNPGLDEWEPVERDPLPNDVLAQYKGKSQTQAELVRRHLWHYETIGEALQVLEQDGRHLYWSIRSPLAVDWRGDGVLLQDVPGGTLSDGTASLVPYETVKRMWIPDEDFPGLATAPLQGVLRDCERLWSIHRRMQRTADSALGMAAILWTPDEAHMKFPRGVEGAGDGGPATNLEAAYAELARRSFEDDDNIEAIVPPMFRWSKEFGKPEKVDLSQPFDDKAIAWVEEALQRIGGGLDYPQQLLVDGGANMNHWGAWLLEEQFARTSLAPKLERVCWGDLTQTFLRPALRAMKGRYNWTGDPDRYRVGFDITPVVVHPDQSSLAIQLYTLGALGVSKLLEVTGFDAGDAPTKSELEQWLFLTLSRRETIRPQTPSSSPPGEAQVLEQAPAGPPSSPAIAALGAGPFVAELPGWLD